MGIHDLLPFLRKAGAVTAPVWSAVPPGARAAVDVPIFMHKFLHSEQGFEGITKRFVRLAETIQSRGLQPTFVFDGPKLDLKAQERKRRAVAANAQMDRYRMKRSAELEKALQNPEEYFVVMLESPPQNEGPLWPTSHDYDNLWFSLQAEGLVVARAKHEAEALCAHLVLTGEAWCSITEDTDSVAFGCPRTVFKFLAAEPELVEAHVVHAKLKLTADTLTDFCMMCGSDFTDRIHLVGPVKALSLMQKWGNWPSVYQNCRAGWTGRTAQSADVFRDVYPVMKDMFASSCYESRLKPDKKEDGVDPLSADASGGLTESTGPERKAGHAETADTAMDHLQEPSAEDWVEAVDVESPTRDSSASTEQPAPEQPAPEQPESEQSEPEQSEPEQPAAKRFCYDDGDVPSNSARRGSDCAPGV